MLHCFNMTEKYYFFLIVRLSKYTSYRHKLYKIAISAKNNHFTHSV